MLIFSVISKEPHFLPGCTLRSEFSWLNRNVRYRQYIFEEILIGWPESKVFWDKRIGFSATFISRDK